MSGSGTPSRATNALLIRAESIKKWMLSETAKEKTVRTDEQFTIKFDKGIIFLSAVASADLDETLRLLDEGVNIDFSNNDGLTALHQACIDENEEMVNLLIERGANIEAVDNEGWTPLHAASSAGSVEIAQILVENGANLAAVNNEGEIPLDLADEDEMDEFLSDEIDNQDLEVEEARNEEEQLMIEDATSWLNQKKVEETLDWQEASALHVAASKGYNKVICTLLQIGNMDVNIRDVDGWTPLHAAVHWGSKTACELLTEAGADFDLKNSNGQTPCDLAEPEFVKTAENFRKRSKELAKKPNFKNKQRDNGTDVNENSVTKEYFAISLLKKQPPRPIVKGSRTKFLNKQNNSEPNNESEEENEKEDEEEVESEPEEEAPPPVKPTPISVKINSTGELDSTTNSTSTTKTSAPSRFGNRERDDKKETSSPAMSRTTIGVGLSRVKREPEPEPAKPIGSRFGTTTRNERAGGGIRIETKKTEDTTASATSRFDRIGGGIRSEVKKTEDTTTSRNDRVGGGFRTDTKKTEDTTTTTATAPRSSVASRLNQRLASSSRDDDSDSILNRYRPKVKNDDDNNWRTRKKDDENDSQEPETKRNSRTETDTSERRVRPSTTEEDTSRTGRPESIAERLRKKNQELLASTSSDRPLTERNSGSTTSVRTSTRTSITTSSDTGDAKDIQRKLDQALKEAEDYKSKYEKMKKEKEDIEKQLDQYKEDIDKMQELKSDNIRLKDENGALIRVISKLSRTPASSS